MAWSWWPSAFSSVGAFGQSGSPSAYRDSSLRIFRIESGTAGPAAPIEFWFVRLQWWAGRWVFLVFRFCKRGPLVFREDTNIIHFHCPAPKILSQRFSANKTIFVATTFAITRYGENKYN